MCANKCDALAQVDKHIDRYEHSRNPKRIRYNGENDVQIARRLAAVGAEQHYYARAERKVDRYLLVQLQAAAVEDSTRGVDNERIIAIEQRGYRSDKAAYKTEAP